jgi:hypothetical protein
MKGRTAKALVLSKETLRNLEELSGKSLQEAVGGTYTWSCSCRCSGGQNSKGCCP